MPPTQPRRCTACGSRRLHAWRPLLDHRRQWDADGDESCAHTLYRQYSCIDCGGGLEVSEYLGLHRYCQVGR